MEKEKYAFLVWDFRDEKITLGLIASEEKTLDRYLTRNRKEWLCGGAVTVEKVMMDHLYGANDMKIVTAILRNSK